MGNPVLNSLSRVPEKKLRENNDVEIGQNEPKMEHKDRLPLVEAFIIKVQRQGNIVPFAFPHAQRRTLILKGISFQREPSCSLHWIP